jgi:hypothetical protein
MFGTVSEVVANGYRLFLEYDYAIAPHLSR